MRRDSGDDASAEPLVELRDVSLRFVNYSDRMYTLKRAALDLILRRERIVPNSAFWALQGINLRIRHGERIGIVGSNGAGKSTLLRMLARIYPPTSGTVEVRGRVAPLIEMGAGFNWELTGHDNILLNGAMLGFTRQQMLAKIDGIHEFTGLREFADKPLKYYSSGMTARLAFAVATEIDPEILLVDETLGVGDAVFRSKAKERIRDLMGRSHAVVLVSHDLGTVRDLCDRAVWLQRGQIVADGPVHEIVKAYAESMKTAPAPLPPDAVPAGVSG
ncbi:ABC transporter ATP-binding protein [Paludisphaera rhizosphaerae]|uniref:ABC transporter ATP-binding protein n=1 Tax=Paludisphaera rhizosphaerae TaxID=2711216 RepID=UPI001F0DA601|nr:ABC transporter ATP-binding protein [Paludisphaera rhizosphaerae]